VPLDHGIRDEQKVTPPQLRGERHGNDVGELALGEVSDVVVLADDEALTAAVRPVVDTAVHLENDRPVCERELGVRVRDRDNRLRAVRSPMEESSSVRPDGDERDKVELLSKVLEGSLERMAVAGRDE